MSVKREEELDIRLPPSRRLKRPRPVMEEEEVFDELYIIPRRKAGSSQSASILSSEAVPEKVLVGSYMPCVEMTNVCKSYKKPLSGVVVKAIDRLTLLNQIRRSEFFMIRGPPSSGKSTLLSLMALLELPTSGQLKIMGRRIRPKVPYEVMRIRQIGHMLPTFPLFEEATVLQNVVFPMDLRSTRDREKESRAVKQRHAETLLREVGLSEAKTHLLPHQLTLLERRQAELARAVANHRRSSYRDFLLAVDEPTRGLNARDAVRLMDAILHINVSQHVTCVVATGVEELECYADRILNLEKGQLAHIVLNEKQQQLDAEKYAAYQAARGRS